jgi:hypothetical protein
LVNELDKKGKMIYICELCGFGYADLEMAERCEQYCYTHGSSSIEITEKAVYRPPLHVSP